MIKKEDAVFYLDMIDASISPNFKPQYYRKKPLYKLLKDRSSSEYKRFINVYETFIHLLSEREQIVLNGIYIEEMTLKAIAEELQLTPERVRQLAFKAETRIAYGINKIYKFR